MSGEPLVRFVRDEVFPFFAEVADDLGASFMTRRPARDRRADRADPGGRPGQWPGARPRGRRHQGRPVRARAAPDQAGRRAGPVPHARGTSSAPSSPWSTRRRARRSTTRRRARRASWSPPTTTSGSPTPRRAGIEEVEVDGKPLRRGAGDRLSDREWDRLRHGTFFGNDVDPKMVQPRHHEPDAARPARRAHPAPERAHDHARPRPSAPSWACRSTATTWCSRTRPSRAGSTRTASSRRCGSARPRPPSCSSSSTCSTA